MIGNVDDIRFFNVISPRKRTTAGKASAAFDTRGMERVLVVLQRGTLAANLRFRGFTSDTVSATASGMTAITGFDLSGLATSSLTYAVDIRKKGDLRRFVGVTVSNANSANLGVFAIGVSNKAIPPATTGFTSVTRVPALS